MSTALSAIEGVNQGLVALQPELKTVLPPSVTPEKFVRVVMTACMNTPALVTADRDSLFGSCLKCAQDGLVPDGREAALVIYNTKVKGDGGRDHWIKKVQYMPMVYGIVKKVHNTGEIESLTAQVVHENDSFDYQLGDNESITHKPALNDRGDEVAVYAICKTKAGGIYREVMGWQEVERVRQSSRSKDDGPWSDWWGEMAKKTVIRRMAKRLPQSAELDQTLSRDDWQYEALGPRREPAAPALMPQSAEVTMKPPGDPAPAKEEPHAVEVDAEPVTSQPPESGAFLDLLTLIQDADTPDALKALIPSVEELAVESERRTGRRAIRSRATALKVTWDPEAQAFVAN